jgi:hypothetical protein
MIHCKTRNPSILLPRYGVRSAGHLVRPLKLLIRLGSAALRFSFTIRLDFAWFSSKRSKSKARIELINEEIYRNPLPSLGGAGETVLG